jgi:hypothetical protein
MVAASIAKWQTGHKMLIGLMAAALACVGYGTASVLQAYGARSSEVVASGNRQRSEVTATGAPTLRATIHAVLTPTFVAGMVLDIVGFLGSIVSARLIPLFLSQTIISATALLGVLILGVRLRRHDWMAIATVVGSLLVLALTAGHPGVRPAERALHWGVLATSLVILGAGIALIRVLGARAAVVWPAGMSTAARRILPRPPLLGLSASSTGVRERGGGDAVSRRVEAVVVDRRGPRLHRRGLGGVLQYIDGGRSGRDD